MHTPLNILANRYIEVLARSDYANEDKYLSKMHLYKMLQTIIKKESEWPLEKLYNWLGYVSGIMTANKLLDIDTEREFSRPIYHQYYEYKGVAIPETINLSNCFEYDSYLKDIVIDLDKNESPIYIKNASYNTQIKVKELPNYWSIYKYNKLEHIDIGPVMLIEGKDYNLIDFGDYKNILFCESAEIIIFSKCSLNP